METVAFGSELSVSGFSANPKSVIFVDLNFQVLWVNTTGLKEVTYIVMLLQIEKSAV